MSPTRKVFLSYRSVDRERVRPIAEALRTAHSIDAWWDTWEIKPGDNFVSKINEGLDQCECGIVFLSKESLAGAWQQDEITTLKVLAVEKKLPLIPVLLDPGIDIDPILLPYSRLSADQIPELAAAILNRAANKPALGPAAPSPTRARFTIHLRELPNNTGIAVSPNSTTNRSSPNKPSPPAPISSSPTPIFSAPAPPSPASTHLPIRPPKNSNSLNSATPSAASSSPAISITNSPSFSKTRRTKNSNSSSNPPAPASSAFPSNPPASPTAASQH
jgi:hypothetical protein